jgi:phosphotransferase system  glucose/maltose/N-acetylglucosamine-specific IIC component
VVLGRAVGSRWRFVLVVCLVLCLVVSLVFCLVW